MAIRAALPTAQRNHDSLNNKNKALLFMQSLRINRSRRELLCRRGIYYQLLFLGSVALPLIHLFWLALNRHDSSSLMWFSISHILPVPYSDPQQMYGDELFNHSSFPSEYTRTDTSSSSMAACLIIKDDSHWLIEWIAYHYHVLPLRRLIVVQDPFSRTSVIPILDRWKSYINISVWNSSRFLKPHFQKSYESGKIPQWRLHRLRQQFFYPACLQYIKSQFKSDASFNSSTDASWVLIVDTDEFVRPNPYYFDNSFDERSILHLSRPGSVVTAMREHDATYDVEHSNHQRLPPACLHIPRMQISSRIDAADERDDRISLMNPVIGSDMKDLFNYSHFLTTSWFYHAGHEINSGHDHLDGKNVINVMRLNKSDIPRRAETVHYIIPGTCPIKVKLNVTPLLIHHYLGSLAQYTSRIDPRDAIPGRKARDARSYKEFKAQGIVRDTSVVVWLPGFVKSVGRDEAQRLLSGVGVVV